MSAMSAAWRPGPERLRFERLVAEHHAMVLRVCRSVLRDEHLGADAAQETFLRLWNEVRAGRAPRHFGGWLMRVAVRTSLDLVRRAPSPRRAALESEPPVFERAGGELERHELEERFARALATLSEGQRTVFLLRHFGGLTLVQVAESLGIAHSTAKTHFARACLELQDALKEDDR